MNAASKSPEAPSDGARTKKFDRPAQEAQRKYSPRSRALTRGKRPRCKSQSEGEKQGLPANYRPMGGAGRADDGYGQAGEDIRPAWPEAIRQSHGPEQSRGAIR